MVVVHKIYVYACVIPQIWNLTRLPQYCFNSSYSNSSILSSSTFQQKKKKKTRKLNYKSQRIAMSMAKRKKKKGEQAKEDPTAQDRITGRFGPRNMSGACSIEIEPITSQAFAKDQRSRGVITSCIRGMKGKTRMIANQVISIQWPNICFSIQWGSMLAGYAMDDGDILLKLALLGSITHLTLLLICSSEAGFQ